jgi:hypothetical protein
MIERTLQLPESVKWMKVIKQKCSQSALLCFFRSITIFAAQIFALYELSAY